MSDNMDTLRARVVKLEAENARMRATLERIAASGEPEAPPPLTMAEIGRPGYTDGLRVAWYYAAEAARKALSDSSSAQPTPDDRTREFEPPETPGDDIPF